MSAKDLLNAIKAGDYVAATSAFEAAMPQRLEDRIESQKPAIAAGFFGSEFVEEEVEAIEELSRNTLNHYQRKNTTELVKRNMKRNETGGVVVDPKKVANREKGFDKAQDRLDGHMQKKYSAEEKE